MILKFLVRKSKLYWHATSEEEKESINDFLHDSGEVVIAQNIPNIKPYATKVQLDEMSTLPLRLVTIAVISPMKNIYEVVEALTCLDFPVSYDIYGPIKDQRYWRKCQRLILFGSFRYLDYTSLLIYPFYIHLHKIHVV